MNKIISLFIKDENYELEVAIRKATKDEATKAEKFAKESKYVWPHDDTHNGSPIDTAKLYRYSTLQNSCLK